MWLINPLLKFSLTFIERMEYKWQCLNYKPRMKVALPLPLLYSWNMAAMWSSQVSLWDDKKWWRTDTSPPCWGRHELARQLLWEHEGAKLRPKNYSPVSNPNCHTTALGIHKCFFYKPLKLRSLFVMQKIRTTMTTKKMVSWLEC